MSGTGKNATADFAFSVLARDGAARRGRLVTRSGVIETPVFMPVGTQASVKAVLHELEQEIKARIILANTYHLMVRPGAERVASLGGLHRFMGWKGAILTDSGGFQIMSLGHRVKLTEEAATFRSHIDGRAFALSPERAMAIQAQLGSDIRMQLDQCLALPAGREAVENAMALSLRWARRSQAAFAAERSEATKGCGLFGIVQGGLEDDLRARSLDGLMAMDMQGFAIGGLAVGESQEEMFDVLDALTPRMPEAKPRYLMGVGTPGDMLGAVRRGVDMFDCVMPTRAGRHGLAFTHEGRINLRNAVYAQDDRPLDARSSLPLARAHTRAYLHHLVKAREPLAGMILSLNNLHYYADFMEQIRRAIGDGNLEALCSRFAGDAFASDGVGG